MIASFPPIFTLLHALLQSCAVQGIHGMGVRTPSAAAVAAATMGFAGLEHIPKGRIFKNGTWSDFTATGRVEFTFLSGITMIGVGILPKLHFSKVPWITMGFIQIPTSFHLSHFCSYQNLPVPRDCLKTHSCVRHAPLHSACGMFTASGRHGNPFPALHAPSGVCGTLAVPASPVHTPRARAPGESSPKAGF